MLTNDVCVDAVVHNNLKVCFCTLFDISSCLRSVTGLDGGKEENINDIMSHRSSEKEETFGKKSDNVKFNSIGGYLCHDASM